MRETNPHGLCTLREASACEGCPVSGRLECRFALGGLIRFFGSFMCFFIPAAIGIVLGGYGPWLWGWLAFMLFFFGVWESRVLCSHCPFYAEARGTLHCMANYGIPKLWKYRPGPMESSEKAQLLLGFAILGGYPLPFLLLGRAWVPGALTVLGGVIFFYFALVGGNCARCVNFSCPLNRVPKAVIDAYLERNSVMRSAWEERGWRVRS